jgi:hypothetical protein
MAEKAEFNVEEQMKYERETGERGRGLCNAQLLLKSSQEAQISPFYKRVTMSLQTLAMIQSWKL